MAKFKFYAATRYVGSKVSEVVEIDDEELEGLNDTARFTLINDFFEEWVWNNIDAGWTEE